MFHHWQKALAEEAQQKERHEERRQARRERKERKLLKLHLKALQQQQQKQNTGRRTSTGTNASGLEVGPSASSASRKKGSTEPASMQTLPGKSTRGRQGKNTFKQNARQDLKVNTHADGSTSRGSSMQGAAPPTSSRETPQRTATLRNKLTLAGLPSSTASTPRSSSLSPTRRVERRKLIPVAGRSNGNQDDAVRNAAATAATPETASDGSSPQAPAPKPFLQPRRNSVKNWTKQFRNNTLTGEKNAVSSTSSNKKGAFALPPWDSTVRAERVTTGRDRLVAAVPLPRIIARRKESVTGPIPPRPPSPISTVTMARSSSSPLLSQLINEEAAGGTPASVLQSEHLYPQYARSNPNMRVSRAGSHDKEIDVDSVSIPINGVPDSSDIPGVGIRQEAPSLYSLAASNMQSPVAETSQDIDDIV
jgi:hypothetical protein